MKKACGIAISIYVTCALAIAVVIYLRKPEMLGWSPVAAVPAWFGVTYIWEVARRLKTAAIIRRAQSGEPPRDGEKIAAIGRISASGEALLAPFSKTPAVIYEYKIATGTTSDDTNSYIGAAQIPSAIQTQYGGVRLLAHPDLKFPERIVSSENALANAREYVQATTFNDTGVGNLTRSLQTLIDIYKDEDGSVRYDNRIQNASGVDNAVFFEKVVRPGDEVCVIGTYSVQRGGIIPDLKSPLINQVTLEPGSGELPLRRARSGAIGYFIGACIFLGVVAAGYYFGL